MSGIFQNLRLHLDRVSYWREGYRKLALENEELKRSLAAFKGHQTRKKQK